MLSRTLALMMALAVLLVAAGCSKNSSADAAGPKSANLGTVELSYGVPSRQDLGDKVACVLTAQPLDPMHFELYASVERSGKEVGHTRIAPTAIDSPVKISCGNCVIDLTPHIKQ